MGSEAKTPHKCVDALSGHIQCALPGCDVWFKPKRKWQEYCVTAHQREYQNRKRKKGGAMYEKKEASGGMHFARIEKSPRLQKVLKVLEDSKEHTTLEIQNEAVVCAVGAIIGELRMNGFNIECNQGKSASGSRIYRYQLKKGGEEAA